MFRFKRCMRMISLVLVVALLFNLLPAQAMAQYAQANADISDSLPEDAEQAQILGEDKRTVPLSRLAFSLGNLGAKEPSFIE